MRFLADECVAAEVVAGLRDAGHDVRYIAEGNRGATDRQVFDIAAREGCLLITEDKDFAFQAALRSGRGLGVLLYRLDPLSQEQVRKRLVMAVERMSAALHGHLTIVEPSRIRSRPLVGPRTRPN